MISADSRVKIIILIMVGGVDYHSCCYYHCYYYRSNRVNLFKYSLICLFIHWVLMIYCCLIMHLMWALMGRSQP